MQAAWSIVLNGKRKTVEHKTHADCLMNYYKLVTKQSKRSLHAWAWYMRQCKAFRKAIARTDHCYIALHYVLDICKVYKQIDEIDELCHRLW